MARTGDAEPRQQLDQKERESLDELTDQLIDKREKFQYFIVTATTAVIVFSFTNANSPDGVLQDAPGWMPLAAWLLLALAAGLSLFGVWTRHDLNWTYLQGRYEGYKNLAELPSAKQLRVTRLTKRLRAIQGIVAVLFMMGVMLLALAYTMGL